MYDYEKDPVTKRIHTLRNLILYHSCAYYEFGESFVSDHQWSEWARELYTMQLCHPDKAAQMPYSEEFKDFDYSSGYDLKIPENVRQKVRETISRHKKQE